MIWMLFTESGRTTMLELTGCRVLLVEDDYLIGLKIKEILEAFGCEVMGPVASANKAVRLLEDDLPDAAVLDINIADGTSVPVAELLQRRCRPFIFVSGYQNPGSMLPEVLRQVRLLPKPVDEFALRDALNAALS